MLDKKKPFQAQHIFLYIKTEDLNACSPGTRDQSDIVLESL
jgi:hypothetical protein